MNTVQNFGAKDESQCANRWLETKTHRGLED